MAGQRPVPTAPGMQTLSLGRSASLLSQRVAMVTSPREPLHPNAASSQALPSLASNADLSEQEASGFPHTGGRAHSRDGAGNGRRKGRVGVDCITWTRFFPWLSRFSGQELVHLEDHP